MCVCVLVLAEVAVACRKMFSVRLLASGQTVHNTVITTEQMLSSGSYFVSDAFSIGAASNE